MKNLTILRGHGKGGVPEPFQSIVLSRGELWTIVGNTGSGKSRLIKDIEQLSDGDSVTGRHVLLDGAAVPIDCRQRESTRLVAHLGLGWVVILARSGVITPSSMVRRALSRRARAKKTSSPWPSSSPRFSRAPAQAQMMAIGFATAGSPLRKR